MHQLEPHKDLPLHKANLWRYASLLMAAIIIAFGASVAAGWIFEIEALIRYTPNTAAMVFNSAVCFMLFGTAIILKLFDRNILSSMCIAIILVIAGLAICENCFAVNFGIDQIFIQHFEALNNSYPGRMHPNSSILFIISSIVLLSLNLKAQHQYWVIIGLAINMVSFTLLVVFLVGYSDTLSQAYISDNKGNMATTAAVGFILLSINFIFLAAYISTLRRIKFAKYLALLVTICIIIASGILASNMRQQALVNNFSSMLPNITLIGGSIIAIVAGVFLYVAVSSYQNYKIIKHSLAVMQTVLNSTADAIIVINSDGGLITFNDLFLKMLGLTYDEAMKIDRKMLTHLMSEKLVDTREYFIKRKIIAEDPYHDGVDELKFKNGNIYERHIRPHILDGEVIGRVASYRDITLQRRLEQQLMRQTTYDELTGLPNRALLFDLVTRSITSDGNGNEKIALFLINIDKFAIINDTYGRANGDLLLKLIAQRLSTVSHSPNVLGRLGSDEFVIILNDFKKIEVAILMVEKILSIFKNKFEISGNLIPLTVSIGVTFYPEDGKNMDTLLSNADIAMLRAKKEGRNTFTLFTQDMSQLSINQVMLQAQLHNAVNEEQFLVYYQPVFDLHTLKPVGVEALVRWVNPEGNIVQPLDFIPLAEEVGLINPIGELVIIEVCKQIQAWNQQGIFDLKVAINVSAHQLKHGKVFKAIKEACDLYKINPKQIEVELTEGVFIERSVNVENNLKLLKEMGIAIVIDDFGVGYSSFSYVKRFKVSKIKIDHSFVIDAPNNAEDRIIVNAMIAMGSKLEFIILAEGIESQEHAILMRDMGCNQGQGFYLAKPMPVEECTAFLLSHLQK